MEPATPADDVRRVLDRIEALMIELGRLRAKLEAARQGELRPQDVNPERRQGDRRQGADRRTLPTSPCRRAASPCKP